MSDFTQLGIQSSSVQKLKEWGISNPTPIQEQAIPPILENKDIVAKAQTGTGKTLAFILPMLEKVDMTKDYIQGLILTPTRELAIQVTEELKKINPHPEKLRQLSVYGGQDVERQIKKLQQHIRIVVATPGRLLDHLRRGTIDLSHVSMLVLDEADQMLHMGFISDVETIIGNMPRSRQTLLFSATIPQDIQTLAKRYMKQPKNIAIQEEQVTVKEVKQIVCETTDREKQDVLCRLVDQYRPFLAVIFCRTKRRVMKLNEALLERGYLSDELHGDLSQSKREQVMTRFRDAKIQLLVATDVAARGIDVVGVTHVINYDIPRDVDSYIHRIGRTGRAGGDGVAITLVTQKDRADLVAIERRIKMQLKKQTVEKISKPQINQSDEKVQQQKKSYKETKKSNTTRKGNQKVKPGYKKKQQAAMKKKLKGKGRKG